MNITQPFSATQLKHYYYYYYYCLRHHHDHHYHHHHHHHQVKKDATGGNVIYMSVFVRKRVGKRTIANLGILNYIIILLKRTLK